MSKYFGKSNGRKLRVVSCRGFGPKDFPVEGFSRIRLDEVRDFEDGCVVRGNEDFSHGNLRIGEIDATGTIRLDYICFVDNLKAYVFMSRKKKHFFYYFIFRQQIVIFPPHL